MAHTAPSPLRLPERFRKKLGTTHERARVHAVMRARGLSTVCEEARCPNIGECFASGTATFMIAGARCTRRCHFCAVTTAKPLALDADEPAKLADAARQMGLNHVVITSVDRDDLADRGAAHWAACVTAVKRALPHATVEILTPDFGGAPHLVDIVLAAGAHVFNHNTETVERLYRAVRPQSRWEHTQGLLEHVAKSGHPCVKSGIMVGLGETDDEVCATLDGMRARGVHVATIGQYLRPSLAHWPVDRYVEDASYARFIAHGNALGFTSVFAGPFVRSSYHAGETHAVHTRARTSLRVLA